MSVFSGPEIANNGLVFHYDMSNTQKSWKGAPSSNLLTYSEDFSNAIWTKNQSTVTSDLTIAPDGNLTADKLIENTSAAEHYVLYNNAPMVGGTRNTISVYAKANERVHLTLYAANKDAGGIRVRFNLNDGASTILGTLANLTVNPSVSVGNNWWRLSITIDGGTGATVPQVVFQTDTGSLFNYTGTANYGVYIWGAQLEASSYATPYIPTTTASTSRTTSNNIVDLTGVNTVTATSLTYNSDNTFSFNGTSNYLDCGNSTAVQLPTDITMEAWVKPVSTTGLGNIMSKNYNSGYRFRIQSGSLWWYVSGNSITGGSVPNGSWAHCVVTGNSSGLKSYVNGVLVASNSTAFAPAAPTVGTLYIGTLEPSSEPFNGTIGIAKVYNRALSAVEVFQNFEALRGRYNI